MKRSKLKLKRYRVRLCRYSDNQFFAIYIGGTSHLDAAQRAMKFLLNAYGDVTFYVIACEAER